MNEKLARAFDDYSEQDLPLGAYAGMAAVFNLLFAGVLLLSRLGNRPLPERTSIRDLVLVGVATHKASRLLARDWVTSFYRAPFTQQSGATAIPGEISDHPRGQGLQRAIGQLVTCASCTGQWVAAFFMCGLVLAPRPTRLVAATFAAITASDFLHQAYEAANAGSAVVANKASGASDEDAATEASVASAAVESTEDPAEDGVSDEHGYGCAATIVQRHEPGGL